MRREMKPRRTREVGAVHDGPSQLVNGPVNRQLAFENPPEDESAMGAVSVGSTAASPGAIMRETLEKLRERQPMARTDATDPLGVAGLHVPEGPRLRDRKS